MMARLARPYLHYLPLYNVRLCTHTNISLPFAGNGGLTLNLTSLFKQRSLTPQATERIITKLLYNLSHNLALDLYTDFLHVSPSAFHVTTLNMHVGTQMERY
jgi:hypothetical protein